jgi:hypothetical protein
VAFAYGLVSEAGGGQSRRLCTSEEAKHRSRNHKTALDQPIFGTTSIFHARLTRCSSKHDRWLCPSRRSGDIPIGYRRDRIRREHMRFSA